MLHTSMERPLDFKGFIGIPEDGNVAGVQSQTLL
jgi:hypothetical protein